MKYPTGWITRKASLHKQPSPGYSLEKANVRLSETQGLEYLGTIASNEGETVLIQPQMQRQLDSFYLLLEYISKGDWVYNRRG